MQQLFNHSFGDVIYPEWGNTYDMESCDKSKSNMHVCSKKFCTTERTFCLFMTKSTRGGEYINLQDSLFDNYSLLVNSK